jgi:hypothetical protein
MFVCMEAGKSPSGLLSEVLVANCVYSNKILDGYKLETITSHETSPCGAEVQRGFTEV